MENPNLQPETEQNQPGVTVGESYGTYQRPSRRGHYTVIAVIVMLTVAAVFARSQWLRIRHVEISGLRDTPFEHVLQLAGISEKSTYFNLNEEKIRRGIESDRYLQFLSMEKIWPNSLILNLRERQRQANIVYMGVQFTTSSDGMVLETTSNITLDNGCVKVTGLNVRDIRVGAVLVCQSSLQMEAMQQVMDELEMQGVIGDVAELNLSSLESIYLVTLDGYTANIGDTEDLRAKIGTVRAVVQELRRRGLAGGMIEATVPGQASYRPMQ